MTTNFRVGRGIGIVGDDTVALFEPLNGDLVEQLWTLVSEGADLDDLLELISTGGLRSLGSFAMFREEGRSTRIVVRGIATAVVETETGAEAIDASGVRTWVEESVDGVRAITIALGDTPSDPMVFRTLGGVVAADALQRGVAAGSITAAALDDVPEVDPSEIVVAPVVPASPIAAPSPVVSAVVDPVVSTSTVSGADEPFVGFGLAEATPSAPPPDEAADAMVAEPVVAESVIAEPVVAEPVVAEPLVAEPAAEPAPPVVAADEPSGVAIDEHDAAVAPGVAATPPASIDPSRTLAAHEYEATPAAVEATAVRFDAGVVAAEAPSADDYDDIYGRTIARSVQQAAVRHDPVPEADADESAPARAFVAAPPPGPADVRPAPLIDGIPLAIPTNAPPSQPTLGGAQLGDHDGHTMTRAQIEALRAQAAGGAPAPSAGTMGAPSVQAVMCPNHHANPVHQVSCRVCRSPISGSPVTIARPSLGSLRFSDGTIATLERPLLIGRNPKLEGSAKEVPALVKLEAGPSLSRTHAVVRLEGWQVLLEDLNSANGTMVRLPGREPRRLHPGEPMLLEPGASIDLGGEITCVYEAV